ncbi:lysine exporter LysO family protein [Francisella sp. LA112445]|uniref:lysine exporter LysO family protein n=1 Tax=Francisella sp. LA112445 TaxID=1395624 RepID=UPI001788CA2F|nr:lysine exporter LysO family protein [Francisella sp. LA112445]QIW10194.1 lysine exporter LysO family protein [Francisella sp. LA112445]
MLESLLLFVTLIIGYYLFNFKPAKKTIRYIDLSLNFIVISIIFLLGYNFSIFTNTNSIVLEIIGISFGYSIVILIANISGVSLYCYYNKHIKTNFITTPQKNIKSNILWNIFKASKYLIYLVLGYIIGEIVNIDITKFIDNIVFVMLLGLMLIIGILLKLEKIPLEDIFKNKTALIIVTIVILTSIASALIISLITGISIKQSIMICSGLGWYSLSVVLNTNFLGEYYGMITFMIDFLREIFVITLIPLLRRILSVELVGYAANTAMDFCLPVIKDNYGTKVVPLAISIGLIFTILTPILLILESIVL